MLRTKTTLAAPLAIVAIALSVTVATSTATAPPVGPLPAGPRATIATQTGQLVAVALPQHSGGRVWRIAQPFNSHVLQEVHEQSDIAGNLIVVFKTTGAGNTSLVFALTRGERKTAFESRRFEIHVS
jgi:hypothetical protein